MGYICNGLFLCNATIARRLTCCKKKQTTKNKNKTRKNKTKKNLTRNQENHGLPNSPRGEVNRIWPAAYNLFVQHYSLPIPGKKENSTPFGVLVHINKGGDVFIYNI